MDYEFIQYSDISCVKLFIVDINFRSSHLHPEIECLYILKGELNIIIGGKTSHYKPRDLIIVNSNEAHELVATSETVTIAILQLSLSFFDSYYSKIHQTVFRHYNVNLKDHKIVELTFLHLAYIYFTTPPYYEVRIAGYINILFNYFLLHFSSYQLSSSKYNDLQLRNKRLKRIVHYIESNFANKITLQELAKSENLSTSFLSHFISENLQHNFQDYLTITRLNHAKILIQTTSLSMLDISLLCGFSDYRYMTKAFRLYCDCTPNQYRSLQKTTLLNHPNRKSDEYFLTLPECSRLVEDTLNLLGFNKDFMY
ncbi:AraC family transcriptional regulator [Anaerorhabdus furcosa]|uniref:Cupin domain-containing protein n=1 Tax=Anaerorhabdus furcosa TaxID=118967 RepID=A0A1T4KQM8_9FIRM|nr:AraC family transcriptional regulator [Anaerorhabdus furcosa]SJZ44637.1 Cupin domain-containing protein [Anaerorhabdus furcosa]